MRDNHKAPSPSTGAMSTSPTAALEAILNLEGSRATGDQLFGEKRFTSCIQSYKGILVPVPVAANSRRTSLVLGWIQV